VAREYARTNTVIWQDDDYRSLPQPVSAVYGLLWTHPSLSYCGVLEWHPGRLSQFWSGIDPSMVRAEVDCLRSRRFLIVDDDTEEMLIRSWVRWDGLMKQPRLSVSFVTAFSAVSSNTIRGVLVDELRKLQQREPDLAGFRDSRVRAVLDQKSIAVVDLDPIPDPFEHGYKIILGTGLDDDLDTGLGTGLGQTLGDVSLPVSIPPTPSPSPTTPKDSSSKIASDLDGDPRPEVIELCNHLADRVEENGSKRPGIGKGWYRACRLLLDRDGRTVEQVRKAIDWCQQDTFWHTNVLSMPTLREKYDQLRLKAAEDARKKLDERKHLQAVPTYETAPAPDRDELPWGETS
jgi:hypothetical protein